MNRRVKSPVSSNAWSAKRPADAKTLAELETGMRGMPIALTLRLQHRLKVPDSTPSVQRGSDLHHYQHLHGHTAPTSAYDAFFSEHGSAGLTGVC